MRRTAQIGALVALMLVVLSAPTAHASTIVYSFSGAVTAPDFGWAVGDPVAATVTIDSTQVDLAPKDSWWGWYSGASLVLSVGGRSYSSSAINMSVYDNDPFFKQDALVFECYSVTGPAPGPEEIDILLVDHSRTALSSDHLPLGIDVGAFGDRHIDFYDRSSSGGHATASITAPTTAPVPEPASLVLVGTGLLGAVGRAWKKRKA